ncbi:hypothetical protein L210DRAFT_949252 [Boletus edulis BED1]|uniref:Uncharacterized protein n=1 Tax=Boletus edulis BED1 TaxID=1328754 RepID=A0AAD4GHV2_BOLED|nr:hypothetical protein L210DRAFT_949252 [Boletus edulis BED1]
MPMKTRDKDQSEVTNDRATLRDVIPYGCSLFVMLTTTSSTLSPVFIIPWPARLTWPLRNSGKDCPSTRANAILVQRDTTMTFCVVATLRCCQQLGTVQNIASNVYAVFDTALYVLST